MIDIGTKDRTQRSAKACGDIRINPVAMAALRGGTCPKGDVLVTARIAAIQAVKQTPMTLPMCHPIAVEKIEVAFELDEETSRVKVTVTAAACSKTGVEMEALCGVAAACLTIYDMLKYLGQDMTLEEMKLMEKAGGKSGDYRRQD